MSLDKASSLVLQPETVAVILYPCLLASSIDNIFLSVKEICFLQSRWKSRKSFSKEAKPGLTGDSLIDTLF